MGILRSCKYLLFVICVLGLVTGCSQGRTYSSSYYDDSSSYDSTSSSSDILDDSSTSSDSDDSDDSYSSYSSESSSSHSLDSSSSSSSNYNRCKFRSSDGSQNCTNRATHGDLCDYHYNYLNDTYNALTN